MKHLSRSPLFAASLLGVLLQTGCKRTVPMTDASLTAAVQTRISGDSAIASESIQSSAESGVVTLTGAVSNQAARALAANDAAQVPGVKTVVNNLTVQTAAAVPPVEISPAPAPAPVRAAIAPPREPRKQQRPPRDQGRNSRATPFASETATNVPPPPPQAAPPVPREAPAPPAPVLRTINVPAGSILPIRITQTLDSATTQQGASFSGTLSSDLVIEGATVLRQGASVSGRVTAVQEAAHFKGNSLLTIELTGVSHRGQQIALTTEPYSTEGKGRGKNTALKTGGGAAVGAILGGILGGGKGAAIGAAAGGGTGAGVNAVTRGEQVQIPAETLIRFRLASPFTVRVSAANEADTATPSEPTAPDLQRRPQN